MTPNEEESAADRLRESIKALRDALLSCQPTDQHDDKRELELWFRRHGFTHTQAKRAISLAYSVRRKDE